MHMLAGCARDVKAPVRWPVQDLSAQKIPLGVMRALAVTTTTRSDVLPDVPTVDEFIPGYEAVHVWHRRTQGHVYRNHR